MSAPTSPTPATDPQPSGAAPSRLSARQRKRRANSASAGLGGSPIWLSIPAVVAVAFLFVPLLALVIRAPWGDMGSIVTSGQVRQALWLSLWTATVATIFATLIGVPLAWVLARSNVRGMSLVRTLVTLPLVLPPVVGGVALLMCFGRNGFIGRFLDSWFGWQIPFTSVAVIMAQIFVSMPFLIITVDAALRNSDQQFEEAAATLGANRWTVFRRITLPLIGPSIIAGAVLCWARALGEFGATITFAGSFPGRTQTMPIEVYFALDSEPSAAIALSLILLAVSLIVLITMRHRWLRGLSGSSPA